MSDGAAGAGGMSDGGAGEGNAGIGGAGGEGGIVDPEREKCVASYSVEGSPNPDIGAVLAACPQLGNYLLWVDTQNQDVAYASWSAAMQDRLADLYQTMLVGDPLDDLDCPDPRSEWDELVFTRLGDPDRDPMYLYFTTSQASDLYLVGVAHALALEVTQALPYSLLDYPSAELEPLLSARAVVVPTSQPPKPHGAPVVAAIYQPPTSHDSLGFVCDPRTAYRFLRGETSLTGEDLLGATPTESLANVTKFLTENSVHGFPTEESLNTFQFEIGERLHLGLDEDWTPSDYLIERMGCHSTAELLEELARAVNVPVLGVASFTYSWNSGIDYPFRYNSHRALVYAWTGDEPRILPHLDFINATALWPNYGGPEAPLDYFDLVWRSPESYEAMGIDVDMTMPVVPIVPTNSNGVGETYYDFGRVLSVLTTAEGRFYLRTEACSWDLTSAYCEDPAGGPSALASNHPWGGFQEFSDPTLLQACYDATAACVASLPGGCSDVPATYPEWSATNYLP